MPVLFCRLNCPTTLGRNEQGPCLRAEDACELKRRFAVLGIARFRTRRHILERMVLLWPPTFDLADLATVPKDNFGSRWEAL